MIIIICVNVIQIVLGIVFVLKNWIKRRILWTITGNILETFPSIYQTVRQHWDRGFVEAFMKRKEKVRKKDKWNEQAKSFSLVSLLFSFLYINPFTNPWAKHSINDCYVPRDILHVIMGNKVDSNFVWYWNETNKSYAFCPNQLLTFIEIESQIFKDLNKIMSNFLLGFIWIHVDFKAIDLEFSFNKNLRELEWN